MKDNLIYILRKLIYSIPIILGVCLIVFIIFNVIFGDPSALLLGKNATVQQMADMREQLGLNKPLVMQYLDTVKSAFTLDFGRSWSTKQNIMDMIKAGAFPSLSFALPGFIISLVISIALALVIALYRGGVFDLFARIVSIAMLSISSLTYILFCQWFFAFKLGWFEISGYEEGFPAFIPYALLPAIIWVILSIGPDLRFFRTVVLDELYQDYVRTARSKGLGEMVILFKHVLRNAMVPILTYVLIQLPFLILGSVLIEIFFSIPGLGTMIVNALNSYDFPVIRAMAILSAIMVIVFQLLTDVMYTLVDPRVKLK